MLFNEALLAQKGSSKIRKDLKGVFIKKIKLSSLKIDENLPRTYKKLQCLLFKRYISVTLTLRIDTHKLIF